MLVQITNQVRVVAIVATVLTCSNSCIAKGTNVVDWERLVSSEVRVRCEENLKRYSGRTDSASISEWERLELKSSEYYTVGNRKVLVVIIGCGQFGQLFILDSTSQSPIGKWSKEFNIPGATVATRRLRDLNKDSNPEITIALSGGNRGPHYYFLSIFPDSLSFITDEKGDYDFYGSKVRVEDADNDGSFEIKEEGFTEGKSGTIFWIYKIQGQKAIVAKYSEE